MSRGQDKKRGSDMPNEVLGNNKRHLVIINKIDKKYDCYLNEEDTKDYILKASFKTSSEIDTWLRGKTVCIYFNKRR